MGAGGSTAASCSSLDLANNHRRHYQHHLHEQRMLKYRKQQQKQQAKVLPLQKGGKHSSGSNMLRHSSSNFDLTQNHLLHQESLNEGQQQNMSNKLASAVWSDGSIQTEVYSLSNANYGAARPIMVLPNNKAVSPVHLLSGAKRSNAGVASRIQQQHQRQLNRANELRKFSGSLPSLNNLLDQHQPNNEPISPVTSSYAQSPPPNLAYYRAQQNRLMNYRSAKTQNQKQHITVQCHDNGRNSNHPKANLVNRYDDSSYQDWSSGGQQRTMKKAISLSSLHNSHNHHNHNHQHHDNHRSSQQQPLQRLAHVNDYDAGLCLANKRLVSNCNAAQNHIRVTDRNVSPNINLPRDHTSRFMQQQQHVQYNQPTPLSKKILKFKQVASNRNSPSKSRYKQKQKIQQQQQQQGCPVLPPLPRSQSLHELIQLRATENGQRMRTTGTLRGPLGTGEASNKVNLVVELLENRRQQKMNEEQLASNSRDSTETMLSQASSSDDGIHDVSLSADQSTGDSRHRFSSKPPNSSEDRYNSNHRLSVNNRQDEAEQAALQRVFNKNNQATNLERRFDNSQNRQLEREQSQRVSVNLAEASNVHQPASKSTLKRSVSHSTLQNSIHNLDMTTNDEDESDDLNELAKFLYQFKQRQANKSSSSADMTSSPNEENINLQSSSNEQQSPNSTTSSSGFASSTCTSNSISSAASDELRHKKLEGARAIKQQPGSRKKYPAPKRPDEKLKSKTAPKEQNSSENSNKNSSKNLISGQLKLSSSLLSIVDEYNSTIQSKDKVSPAMNKNSSSNLASVLLGEASTMHMDNKLQPEARPIDINNSLSSSSSSTSVANCHQQHQLEQLRRYTQLRQMSQSELALNHLTSPVNNTKTQIPLVKDKRDHREQRSSKPYKSKIINIIRRISDKSDEADRNSGGNSRSSGRAVAGPGLTVGGEIAQQEYDSERGAINQNKMMASYSNQCKQQKYNHAKTPNGKSCLSESLCDLNFDCDFELIKNCGSATNEHKGAASALPKLSGNSLLEADPSPCVEGGAGRQCQREVGKKHHQQIINSSKGENNWRLVPTSLSLDKPTGFGSGKEFYIQRQQQQTQQPQLQARQSTEETENSDRSKCKLLHTPATNKLASQQAKLKWPASGWFMNSSIGSSSASGDSSSRSSCSSGGVTRTKGKELQQPPQPQQQQACPSKSLISNSRKPLSIATNNNGGALTKEDALIESKSFAKVNSEAKQLLHELDHSLDMVSGRYPFSRKTALSWWKMGDDLVSGSGTNNQLMFKGRGLAQGYEFPGSFNDSDDNDDNDDDDDYDNDDYASINRAMINAIFDVDVNQTKHHHLINDNSNSLSNEPSSPSDSFTFSASNSPAVSPKATTAKATTKTPAGLLESQQAKGENHMSKQQSVGQANQSAKQQQTHSQLRNFGKKHQQQIATDNSNHATASASYERIISQGEGGSGGACGISDCESHSNAAAEAIRSKLADNGAGGNKRIVSYGERRTKDGDRGKVELKGEDSEIRGKSIGLTPIATVANNRTYDGSVGNGSNKLASGGNGGIGKNRDLCDHEHEVSAKKQHSPPTVNESNKDYPSNNNNHDSLCELNKARCLMGGSHLGPDSNSKTTSAGCKLNDAHNNNDHDEDVARDSTRHCCLNGQRGGSCSKPNRLISQCQFSGKGKNFPEANGNQGCRPQKSSSSSGCHFCSDGVHTAINEDKSRNDSSCGSHFFHGRQDGCGGAERTGAKINGFTNGLPTQKLNVGEKQNASCPIQGQQSCGLGQLSSGIRCCYKFNGDTVAVRDNETSGMNGQKQAAFKCDRRSSPKEQLNGRQTVAVENKLSGMRSSNLSTANGRSEYKSSNNICNKKACKCCSNALGCDNSGGGCGKNISSKSRDLHTNGVTYSKTTAPNSEELKNKLITQQKLGTCHCSSDVTKTAGIITSISPSSANNSEICKASMTQMVVTGDAYQSPTKHALADYKNPSAKPALEASNECFDYYEMGKMFYHSKRDKQMAAADKNVALKEQDLLNGSYPTAATADSAGQLHNLDNCCQVATCAGTDNDSRCKVASCHHPSSRLSSGAATRIKTNYNEDVKSQKASVSRDNLILEAGYKLVENESSDKSIAVLNGVSGLAQCTTNCSHKMLVNGGNCRCCRLPKSQQQQQSPIAVDQETNGRLVKRFGIGFGGKISSQNRTTTLNAAVANSGEPLRHSNSKSSPTNGRPLCSDGGGAARFIAKSKLPNKPICRSNSELVPSLDKGSNIVNIMQSPFQQQNQPQQNEQRNLFGKLRNSLLNQASSTEDALSKSSKLACSQVSLVNYHFVSPFIAHRDEQQQQYYHHHGSATALNDQMNVDENFILKRKTPNAGLKSRC